MQKRLLPVLGLVLLSFGWKGLAEIKKNTFDETTKLTAGQLFLNQVDTVSLYLSTENIVYIPHLTEERHLNVDLHFLGMSFGKNRDALHGFAMRHIKTFSKALRKRLDFYTPRLAREFDEQKDLSFVVRMGVRKDAVARWNEGKWYWLRERQIVTEGKPVSQIIREEGIDCKSRCPARIGGKKKVKAVAPPSQEEEIETPAVRKPRKQVIEVVPESPNAKHKGQQRSL